MLLTYRLLFFLLVTSNATVTFAQVKPTYTHPIPFAPREYVCYRTTEPLNIDGKPDETAWQNAPWTETFVDIEGDLKPLPTHDTRVKMLWDDDYFYFYAQLDEPHVWATLRQRDTIIFYDDDFEIFIDPDGDSHNYYELEVNAFNTLWDLILLRPYRADNEPKVLNYWNVHDQKSAIYVAGTLNDPSDTDQYWAVEWAVPWSALKELAPRLPKDGDQWRVNFSRVDWTMEVVNGKYQKAINPATQKPFPENNWVWSPTGFIAMHMPEQWGFVQFSKNVAGTETANFVSHPDEQIKWGLWQLYFQQREFFKQNQYYSDDINQFTIPKMNVPKHCRLEPHISVDVGGFTITAEGCDHLTVCTIREDGKIVCN